MCLDHRKQEQSRSLIQTTWERIAIQGLASAILLSALATTALCQPLPAATHAPAGQNAERTNRQAQRSSQTSSPAHARAPTLTPAQEPPQPATIELNHGMLRIESNNSSLKNILNQLAQQSGMKISGLTHDFRVFGSYGPASPTTVIGQLLEGSGFNLMMIGRTADGAPRELRLSEPSTMPVESVPQNAFGTTPTPADEPPRIPYQDQHEAQPAPPSGPKPANNNTPGTLNPNEIHTPQQFFEMLKERREKLQQEQQDPTNSNG